MLDNAHLRRQFPAVERELYLDAAFQTPLCLPVRSALDAFHDTAVAAAGPKARWLERAEQVRAKLATLIGAAPEEVAFTKNTSEALNICANGLRWESGDNVLLVEGEHPNHAYAWLAKRPAGLEVRQVPTDKGWLDADTFAPYVDARTRAIGLSHVMFHSGQRNDVAGIAELGVPVVVDAMQSVGVMALDLTGATAIAAGGHKGLLTPQGIGFLRAPAALSPTYVATAGVANVPPGLVAGDEPIELHADARRFEIGNLNLAAIHALGAALELLDGIGVARIEEHVLDLGDRLIACADELGIDVVGPRERRRRSHIYVLDLPGPRWPRFLAERGVRVSTVRDGIRVSFGLYSIADDVEQFAEVLRRA